MEKLTIVALTMLCAIGAPFGVSATIVCSPILADNTPLFAGSIILSSVCILTLMVIRVKKLLL